MLSHDVIKHCEFCLSLSCIELCPLSQLDSVCGGGNDVTTQRLIETSGGGKKCYHFRC